MFILIKIKDKIRIDPKLFYKEYSLAATDEIHKKYSGKVLPNHGLCVSVYDIQELGDPFIIPSDGATYSTVIFRLVVFKPWIGEILTGTITHCDYKMGIKVSLGDFFHDIIIPPHLLQPNSEFDETEQVWVWKFEENELFMDVGEPIRFIVNSISFESATEDAKPPKVEPLQTLMQQQQEQKKEEQSVPPMTITGRINEDGLGLVSWWTSS